MPSHDDSFTLANARFSTMPFRTKRNQNIEKKKMENPEVIPLTSSRTARVKAFVKASPAAIITFAAFLQAMIYKRIFGI